MDAVATLTPGRERASERPLLRCIWFLSILRSFLLCISECCSHFSCVSFIIVIVTIIVTMIITVVLKLFLIHRCSG